jgi:hypothetical protein
VPIGFTYRRLDESRYDVVMRAGAPLFRDGTRRADLMRTLETRVRALSGHAEL